jgi:hypothetical protein
VLALIDLIIPSSATIEASVNLEPTVNPPPSPNNESSGHRNRNVLHANLSIALEAYLAGNAHKLLCMSHLDSDRHFLDRTCSLLGRQLRR